ncbi:hypothetical protein HH310_11785 [Actinoplanes sp. TBRC 11911]|uniref:hypothetical protein n=1 Tax=Actinoplanes sp. TBRC 11911 TaxID=2729386 RepID=UPI00145F4650|nr:hypothetical protein [Actinoplanes sp. TBRC 11911]NMO51871.1 hypothetical protein [Actinoplanes sp. TBRC 11911]
MFVVIQFPLVDGRVFTSAAGLVNRPDWGAPQLSRFVAHRDFVRGFGRLAYRRAETSAEWTDEAVFAYARRAVQLPSLQRRHFVGRNGGRWMVSCRFRRLFSDGEATLRLEIGFEITVGWQRKVPAEEVVAGLLALPAVVPGGSAKELALIGPYVARRYAAASTRHGCAPAGTLVGAGDPVVVVEDDFWATEPPDGVVEAGNAIARGRPLRLGTTRTRYGGVETWYLPDAKRDDWRNARLAILRQHAQEESVDRVLHWAATGALSYRPRTPDGDRFEAYVNEGIKIINRDTYRGVDCASMRKALDAVTDTRRATIDIRRRERLDGMRRQVRERAERFLARREARRPTFNVSGRVVHVGEQIFSGQFYGPVAGTVYAEKMENSFNSFAARGPDEQLRHLVAELHEQVADLVGRLRATAPEEAGEVAETLASFTAEAGKEQPNKVTLRALGTGIVEVAKKVAEVTAPVAAAVAAVLKLF